MDAQGPDRPRPYVEQAGATFKTVVDSENVLGQTYGFKAIPNGFLIDEQGVVQYRGVGGFDVRRDKTRAVLDQWTARQPIMEDESRRKPDPGDELTDSNELFRQGQAAYRDGRVDEALVLWKQGVQLDPDNYIVRKQIWAVENPDRFYDGDVDYDWQRQQMGK